MVESYTEKMSDELIHLKKEDQAYVKKMVAYIGAKSYFYDDEALGEQLYNMVCDLKVADPILSRAQPCSGGLFYNNRHNHCKQE